MINCYSAQKLLAKLPIQADGLLPKGSEFLESIDRVIDINPLSNWHANLFSITRRQCVLMVHNQTRFPVLLIGLTKKDFAALDYWFADALMNSLLKCGAKQHHMQAAQQLLAPLCFSASNDRSVMGTSNLMKAEFEHMLNYDKVDLMTISAYQASAWLADRPCSVKCTKEGAAKSKKDFIWPIKAMLSLLESITVDDGII